MCAIALLCVLRVNAFTSLGAQYFGSDTMHGRLEPRYARHAHHGAAQDVHFRPRPRLQIHEQAGFHIGRQGFDGRERSILFVDCKSNAARTSDRSDLAHAAGQDVASRGCLAHGTDRRSRKAAGGR